MHIFYCDDDHDDITYFTEIINRINSETSLTTLNDPEEAIALLEKMTVKPNFMFFDANMPKLDGLECTIAIKRNMTLRRIPLIILSGGLNNRQITAYNKLGVHTFVAKTNLDDLEKSLRSVLNEKKL